MFENKKINVPCIGEEVHASRLIASWLNTGGSMCETTLDDEGMHEFMFLAWLRSLGISEEDVSYMYNFADTGKLELELLAKKFRETHEVLDE